MLSVHSLFQSREQELSAFTSMQLPAQRYANRASYLYLYTSHSINSQTTVEEAAKFDPIADDLENQGNLVRA